MGDWHLAVDIGGTFTDIVLLDAAGTTTVVEKVLTTPKDPAAAVMDGLAERWAVVGANTWVCDLVGRVPSTSVRRFSDAGEARTWLRG